MKLQTLILIGLLTTLTACGENATEEEPIVADTDTTNDVATNVLPRTASVAGARIFFITPSDGTTVSSPVSIEFGISDMEVAPAGNNQANSGHHHLLIDTDPPPFDLPIPADSNNIHFGDGSTSTEITLEPGTHQLQMLLGDYLHIPHDPPLLSEKITITVE